MDPCWISCSGIFAPGAVVIARVASANFEAPTLSQECNETDNVLDGEPIVRRIGPDVTGAVAAIAPDTARFQISRAAPRDGRTGAAARAD
jgi:hypothetical protein